MLHCFAPRCTPMYYRNKHMHNLRMTHVQGSSGHPSSEVLLGVSGFSQNRQGPQRPQSDASCGEAKRHLICLLVTKKRKEITTLQTHIMEDKTCMRKDAEFLAFSHTFSPHFWPRDEATLGGQGFLQLSHRFCRFLRLVGLLGLFDVQVQLAPFKVRDVPGVSKPNTFETHSIISKSHISNTSTEL